MQRRTFLTLAAVPLTAAPFTAAPLTAAWAQSTEKAIAFVKSTGDRLVAVVNGPGSTGTKRAAMTKIIDGSVDVDGVGKFCLGRFWRQASPEQQKRYLTLFHEVLVTNITAKLGEYQGVSFTVGRAVPQDDQVSVSTVVQRPNNPPTNVDWVIADRDSSPKIVDVVAEGTSLRLTQRSDYASYLMHNNNDIAKLLAAMKNQVTQNG